MCSPCDLKESDTTEELNINNQILVKIEWLESLLIISVCYFDIKFARTVLSHLQLFAVP